MNVQHYPVPTNDYVIYFTHNINLTTLKFNNNLGLNSKPIRIHCCDTFELLLLCKKRVTTICGYFQHCSYYQLV
jgi:hypothetical protein